MLRGEGLISKEVFKMKFYYISNIINYYIDDYNKLIDIIQVFD